MDLSQNKNPLKHSTSAASGDSGDKGFVVFGPLEISRTELLADLLWLQVLTKNPDNFVTAISLAWHKAEGKEGRERMSRIVHLYRMTMDGKSRPPFNFEAEYLWMGGHKAAPKMILEPR